MAKQIFHADLNKHMCPSATPSFLPSSFLFHRDQSISILLFILTDRLSSSPHAGSGATKRKTSRGNRRRRVSPFFPASLFAIPRRHLSLVVHGTIASLVLYALCYHSYFLPPCFSLSFCLLPLVYAIDMVAWYSQKKRLLRIAFARRLARFSPFLPPP